MTKEKEMSFLEKADPLALEILKLTRSAIFVKLRFLDAALGHLPLSRQDKIGRIATNGRNLYYNPGFILKRYEESPDKLARDCLHLIFHCVLHHPFFVRQVHPVWWNLAVDIAVENALNELDVFPSGRVHEAAADQALTELHGQVRTFTAEGLYRYFAREKLDDDTASHLRQLFYHDDHMGWYAKSNEEKQVRTGDRNVSENGRKSDQDPGGGEGKDAGADRYREKDDQGKGQPQDNQPGTGDGQPQEEDLPSGKHQPGGNQPDGQHEQPQSNAARESGGGEGNYEDGDPGGKDGDEGDAPMKLPAPREDGLFARWKQISQRMQTDLETTSRRWGEESQNLLQSIRGVNREKCDYSAFLRRFSVRGEQMKVCLSIRK